MRSDKKIIMIAGPNGVGKTTFAREFLPKEAQCPLFINADLIAAGLSPFDPQAAAMRAGRLMLAEIQRHVQEGNNFAFETTLSGRGYARMIPEWRAQGYYVMLFFLWIPNLEIALKRIAARVAQGGHSIPETVVRERFEKGYRNFNGVYKSIVDTWMLYDNRGEAPILLSKGKNG